MNKDSNVYDNDEFFKSYSLMERSVYGLESAGEWPQFKQLIPDLKEKNVLDLGCGECRMTALLLEEKQIRKVYENRTIQKYKTEYHCR